MESSVFFNLNIEPKYIDILKVYNINSKKRCKRKLEIFPNNADHLTKDSHLIGDLGFIH